MFKITANPEFTHLVTVMVPQDEGHVEQPFKGRFKVLPDGEAEEFDVASKDGLKDFLRAVWIGVEDVVDDAGKTLSWSTELREQLLGLPYVRIALLRTYMAALTKAKSGN